MRASAALPPPADVAKSPASRRLASTRPVLALKRRLVLARTVGCLLAAAFLVGPGWAGAAHAQALLAQAPPARFADQIQAYLDADKSTPPPRDAILFVGSSIFRQWTDLQKHMAPLPVFNRAFGGSRTPEVLYYMDRIVIPYSPRIIVYYCGSNDINAGSSAGAILGNFREFVSRVRDKLPRTEVFFVSINRAPQKKDRWDIVDAANSGIKAFCAATPNTGYIEVNPVLFDSGGEPRMELYLPDRLHFKPAAYLEFTGVIKPVLEAAWARR